MSHTNLRSIEHICPVCLVPDQKVNACGKCHSIFYCSRKCQHLDWHKHKAFCKDEDQELATARREKCLEIIESYANSIFRYVFFSHYVKRSSFLAVYPDKESKYVPFHEREILNSLEFHFSNSEYDFLSHAIRQTQSFKKDEIEMKGIPVLFVGEKSYSIYVIGSNEANELIQSVKKMPSFLMASIVIDFMRDKMQAVEESSLSVLYSLFSSGVYQKFDSEKKKPPPCDEGASK